VDWLHVDNLVTALLLAADALKETNAPNSSSGGSTTCVAGGRAYFVHDGEPANNFEFLRPIFEGLGYQWPRLRLPYAVVYVFAALCELVCGVARNVAGYPVWVPMLCRMEVAKCAITHYARVSAPAAAAAAVVDMQIITSLIMLHHAALGASQSQLSNALV
jgi:hypothetical protein